jgi:putative transposase
MPRGLVRYHQTGNFHYITFSCFHRLSYLGTPTARSLFEDPEGLRNKEKT